MGGLIPMQRCSLYFLQLQLTGQCRFDVRVLITNSFTGTNHVVGFLWSDFVGPAYIINTHWD